MARIESKLVVSKSAQETFSIFANPASQLKIIPRAVAFNQTSDGAFAQVGTIATGTIRYFGIQMNVDYEIIECEKNKRLTMKGKLGPLNFKDGYVLAQKAAGTEIIFWLELALNGFAKIITPFFWLIGKIHAYETMQNIKRELSSNLPPF